MITFLVLSGLLASYGLFRRITARTMLLGAMAYLQNLKFANPFLKKWASDQNLVKMSTSEKVDAHTLEAMKAVRDYCIKNGMPVPSVVEQNIAHEESKAMKAVRDYCIKNGIAVPNVIEQNIGTHEDKNVDVHEDMAKDVLVAENESILNLDQRFGDLHIFT